VSCRPTRSYDRGLLGAPTDPKVAAWHWCPSMMRANVPAVGGPILPDLRRAVCGRSGRLWPPGLTMRPSAARAHWDRADHHGPIAEPPPAPGPPCHSATLLPLSTRQLPPAGFSLSRALRVPRLLRTSIGTVPAGILATCNTHGKADDDSENVSECRAQRMVLCRPETRLRRSPAVSPARVMR
jgi:hypothetical protein